MLAYGYAADGSKREKKYNGTITQHYRGSIVYDGSGAPEYVATPEGMVRKAGNTWVRQYNLTDHLGNTRAVVENSGTILQQTDYYPFGTAFTITNTSKNKYLYGGKEYQDEVVGGTLFGLSDFEARFADFRIPRFTSIDPLAEKYYSISPYVYCLNNPLKYVDRDGRQPGVTAPRRIYQGYKIYKWIRYGTAAGGAWVAGEYLSKEEVDKRANEVFNALTNPPHAYSASTDNATATSREDWNYTKKRQGDSDKEDVTHAKSRERITPKGDGSNKGGKPKGGILGKILVSSAATLGIIEQVTNPDPSKDAHEAHHENSDKNTEPKSPDEQPKETNSVIQWIINMFINN